MSHNAPIFYIFPLRVFVIQVSYQENQFLLKKCNSKNSMKNLADMHPFQLYLVPIVLTNQLYALIVGYVQLLNGVSFICLTREYPTLHVIYCHQ